MPGLSVYLIEYLSVYLSVRMHMDAYYTCIYDNIIVQCFDFAEMRTHIHTHT